MKFLTFLLFVRPIVTHVFTTTKTTKTKK